ncbi:MAG TPA: cytochrome b/b6 domain-containing protein [Rhizomicrobium sp.]|jgi:cytochrome b|nr:cytochrome b/b6 domain-containing protein [Rhizomicrobium sp.]
MQTDPAVPTPVAGEQVRVWDAPTRLFHWSIVALVFVSWLSADQGYMTVHLWSGLSLLALLLFRLGWGLMGSTTARFGDFLHPPRKVLAYLKTQARGASPLHAGHNPAGGLMVMALLAVLLAQVLTGLFANDGLKFSGPLALFVSDDASDQSTRIHGIIFNIILALVWLHVVAVGFHHFVKGDNLVGPMVSGKKHRSRVPESANIIFAHPALALGLLLASAAVAAWILF